MMLKLMMLAAAAAAVTTAATVAASDRQSGVKKEPQPVAEKRPEERAVYLNDPTARAYHMDYMYV